MKVLNKIFYSFSILATLIFLYACEPEEILFAGPFYVRFTEEGTTIKESTHEIIEVKVHNVGPQLDQAINIFYKIEGDAIEGIDYKVLTEKPNIVKIAKGESFGSIFIEIIDNANNILRSQEVLLTLLSVNYPDLQVGFGKNKNIGITHKLTIQDDCILSGTYEAIREIGTVPVEDISISSYDCEEYLLSNWDINIFDFSFERSLTFVDNGDNTILIPEQEDPSLNPDYATIRGKGTVDPVTGVIILNLELADFVTVEDTTKAPIFTITYTPLKK